MGRVRWAITSARGLPSLVGHASLHEPQRLAQLTGSLQPQVGRTGGLGGMSLLELLPRVPSSSPSGQWWKAPQVWASGVEVRGSPRRIAPTDFSSVWGWRVWGRTG